MSEIISLLDAAHAAVHADPENEALRLRFFERLADGEMFLLLEREAQGDTLDPKVFDLEDGRFVLVFDREERLAGFTGGIAPYAALPGRVIAGLLKGQGIGLGVNLGVGRSEMLLPPEAMDWLAETLDEGPEAVEALPEQFHAPAVPEALITGLDAKLARAAGLASGALLAAVTYRGGRRGHMLAFLDVADGAQGALARAASEALVFSGIEAGELDVAFLHSADPAVAAMARVALRFDLPEVEARTVPGAAPGMDPKRPPRLV
ncbi:MAG: SseB family protein [Pseudotabrizicola sp.]|uniref:SseB family protein n=1 Tax=Pseudotabrizicola sp. TaxID=2939647 RepID=UPI0027166F0E|nr:SseB family protein [Pseudotabrizicola sp.]MDO9638707.1 SseB family protein [Pseudotabrizicola sp.]